MHRLTILIEEQSATPKGRKTWKQVEKREVAEGDLSDMRSLAAFLRDAEADFVRAELARLRDRDRELKAATKPMLGTE